MLEAVQVDGVLHAALQAVDVLAYLVVQLLCLGAPQGVPGAGRLQVALKRLQTLIELLEVGFKFMLAAVSDSQHQHRQIIEDRQ